MDHHISHWYTTLLIPNLDSTKQAIREREWFVTTENLHVSTCGSMVMISHHQEDCIFICIQLDHKTRRSIRRKWRRRENSGRRDQRLIFYSMVIKRWYCNSYKDGIKRVIKKDREAPAQTAGDGGWRTSPTLEVGHLDLTMGLPNCSRHLERRHGSEENEEGLEHHIWKFPITALRQCELDIMMKQYPETTMLNGWSSGWFAGAWNGWYRFVGRCGRVLCYRKKSKSSDSDWIICLKSLRGGLEADQSWSLLFNTGLEKT